MNKLMERPDWLDSTSVYSLARKTRMNYYTGQEIRSKFYNQGYAERNYIPRELEKINWIPDENKTYRCWWFYTNPADPADPGEDVLVYIEEI